MAAEMVNDTDQTKQQSVTAAGREGNVNARPRRGNRARELIEIQSWDEVPAFQSEAEEAEYWGTHGLGEALLAQFEPVPLDGGGELPPARAETIPEGQPRTRPIAIRLDGDVLRRLKAVAAKKHKGYQTLLKEFVVERLYEEERREGLLPPAGQTSPRGT
ncbi:MAG: CopG family antitoxin [Chloroflexota bacterium]